MFSHVRETPFLGYVLSRKLQVYIYYQTGKNTNFAENPNVLMHYIAVLYTDGKK